MAEIVVNLDGARLREIVDRHIVEVVDERDALAAARAQALNACSQLEHPSIGLPWITTQRVRELLALPGEEPRRDEEGAYRYLADAVIERFNPPDGGDAEEWICSEAIHRAAEFIESQPCGCRPETGVLCAVVCHRCQVLGQRERRCVEW